MSYPGIVLLLFAIFGAIFFVTSHLRDHAQMVRQLVLKTAEQRFGGTLRDESWGLLYRYQVDGVDTELSCYPGGDKHAPWTQVHFDWPANERLRVFPEGLWDQVKQLLGSQDFKVGEQAFDAAFVVQGSSEPWAREVLNGEARVALLALSTLGKQAGLLGIQGGIQLDVNAKGVVISCQRDLSYPTSPEPPSPAFLTFLDLSAAVFREIKRAAGSAANLGIAVRATEGPNTCPVCGDAEDPPTSTCDGCNTSYHPECWSYLGGCATFGCGARYTPGQRQRQGSGW